MRYVHFDNGQIQESVRKIEFFKNIQGVSNNALLGF
jgi:hypothetical protein